MRAAPAAVSGGGLGLPPHATGAIGIPAIVPRRDVALVGKVDPHPGQELQRVGGLGARRRTLGRVGPVGHGPGGAVGRQPLQRDGIPRAVAHEAGGKRAIVLRTPLCDVGVPTDAVVPLPWGIPVRIVMPSRRRLVTQGALMGYLLFAVIAVLTMVTMIGPIVAMLLIGAGAAFSDYLAVDAERAQASVTD